MTNLDHKNIFRVLKFPSWDDFLDGIKKFRNYDNEIYKFKKNHEELDKIISIAITHLPSPFNLIADTIYGVDGTFEEKYGLIQGFLNTLQLQGNQHYEDTIKKLEEMSIQTQKISTNSTFIFELLTTLTSVEYELERQIIKIQKNQEEMHEDIIITKKNVEKVLKLIKEYADEREDQEDFRNTK